MGICKCSKRRVTQQFCFEHRVNVCEFCMVNGHPAVSFGSRLIVDCDSHSLWIVIRSDMVQIWFGLFEFHQLWTGLTTCSLPCPSPVYRSALSAGKSRFSAYLLAVNRSCERNDQTRIDLHQTNIVSSSLTSPPVRCRSPNPVARGQQLQGQMLVLSAEPVERRVRAFALLS